MDDRISCSIYRDRRDETTYLYVERPGDFSRVPEPLLAKLGELVHVMDLELHPERKLARADEAAVRAALASQGFYLQLPPREHIPLSG